MGMGWEVRGRDHLCLWGHSPIPSGAALVTSFNFNDLPRSLASKYSPIGDQVCNM